MKTGKKNTLIKIIPLLFLFFLIIGWPLNSLKAQDAAPTELPNPIMTDSFNELIDRIIKWVFNIGIALATVVFLWGGFQFLVSGGNEQKIEQAKKTMLWGAIGLIVVLIAAGVPALIREFLGAEGG